MDKCLHPKGLAPVKNLFDAVTSLFWTSVNVATLARSMLGWVSIVKTHCRGQGVFNTESSKGVKSIETVG